MRSPRRSALLRRSRRSHQPECTLGRTRLYDLRAEYLFGLAGQQRQACARPVPVCRQQLNRRNALIEDSVPASRGRAAGMTVLGFHGGSHCRPGYGEDRRGRSHRTFDDSGPLRGTSRVN